MRKVVAVLTVFIVLVSGGKAKAQYVVTHDETQISVENSSGRQVVNIEAYDASPDRFSVQVAGVVIDFNKDSAYGEHPWEEDNKACRKTYRLGRPGHIGLLEVGMNYFSSVNYSMYDDGFAFMDISAGRSLQWSFCLTDIALKIDRAGIFSITTGFQMLWNNYTFSNNITLDKVDGMIQYGDVPETTKKSKLVTFGFQVPVLLEINFPGRMFISGGVYGGVIAEGHTKVKHPKEKMKDPYLAPFYAGWTVRIGYDSFYVYGSSAFTSLFKSGRGPEAFPFTLGLGFGF